MSDEFQSVKIRISGRVQGVGYREWARRQALELGLSGWVRNEPDRTVSALVAGPQSAISIMIARFHRGPALAAVTRVETEPAALAERPTGFDVLRD